ncbi:hypothetical protein IAU60_000855 [Kwoniella sp. DSM 27419]
MTTPELESDHYDVIVLGTGLAESIAAASLAKAGKSVLHLDPNEYYGGQQASLTLDELASWAQSQRASSSDTQDASSSRISYQQATTSDLSPELEKDKRRYAISLFPSILPSRGKLIDTLIGSDVSKYVSFRLLDSVSVYDESDAQSVPSRVKRVPGSKEEVFKDKSVGLLDKRRLMKFLMFAAGEFEDEELLKGKERRSLLSFLQESFSIPSQLAESIAYAIAHCSSPEDESLPALQRTRRYLQSIGRYGAGAFLVGQYGGAGEVAQGFCRACAVFGGTYVLGPSAKPTTIDAIADGLKLSVPCHPRPITASYLVASPDQLSDDLLGPLVTQSGPIARLTAHGIAISSTLPEALRRKLQATQVAVSDGPETSATDETDTVENDDTAVIVFPPRDGRSLVRCYINGEGTGSCPAGQYIIYLSCDALANDSPSDLLRPYLRQVVQEPIYQSYYTSSRPVLAQTPSTERTILLSPYAGANLMTEGLDHEASEGEKAYIAIVGQGAEGKGFFEKDASEEEEMGIGEE